MNRYQIRLQQLYIVKQLLPLCAEIVDVPFAAPYDDLPLKGYLEELFVLIFDVVYFDYVQDGYVYEIPVPPINTVNSPSFTMEVHCTSGSLRILQRTWEPMLIAYTVAQAYKGGTWL